jgi:uncharacterized protein (DUF433 family)
MAKARRLLPLGEGLYTISEVCRILRPGMTRHKVHYWLNTGLLSTPPVAHRGKGVPTLLSFKQLLEVRTAQHMRDDLGTTLALVRRAFSWVDRNLFGASPTSVTFEYSSQGGTVIARTPEGQMIEIPTNQGVLDIDVRPNLARLNRVVESSRVAWQDKALAIPDYPSLVANAHVMNGSPTIRGTRMETSIIAAFVKRGEKYDADVVERISATYPRLPDTAIREALEFEGVSAQAS